MATAPRSHWIRNLGLIAALICIGGLARVVRSDTGPTSQHNNPGPGDCKHAHGGYYNTSWCLKNDGGEGDGETCTVNGRPGICKTTRQQCYCVASAVAVDGGVKVDAGQPTEPEPHGFGGADESPAATR